MWMSVRCHRVRTVLVWTHLAVFCALVRKDPNSTSLVLVARVSLYWLLHWTKGAGPFGWDHLLFHFKDYYFLSHHHDVNFELGQALIKTIDAPPMGKGLNSFPFVLLFRYVLHVFPSERYRFYPTTAVGNRCGTFLGVGGNANSAATRE